MTRDHAFLDYVLEQLAFVRGLHARAMFGGHGLYQDATIFAIIADDMLYLKVNDATRAEFETEGLRPFSYVARGKTMTMNYYETRAEAFEDADAMRLWVGKALAAALAAPAAKPKRTRRS